MVRWMKAHHLARLARTRFDSLMPRCFACIHCGKCGPPSSDAKVKPAGWCIFCRTQNEADAKVCANCGKATQVPFQPRGDRPVLCRECFDAQRASRY